MVSTGTHWFIKTISTGIHVSFLFVLYFIEILSKDIYTILSLGNTFFCDNQWSGYYWCIPSALSCDHRLHGVESKQTCSNDDTQLSHLALEYCYFTEDVLVRKLLSRCTVNWTLARLHWWCAIQYSLRHLHASCESLCLTNSFLQTQIKLWTSHGTWDFAKQQRVDFDVTQVIGYSLKQRNAWRYTAIGQWRVECNIFKFLHSCVEMLCQIPTPVVKNLNRGCGNWYTSL